MKWKFGMAILWGALGITCVWEPSNPTIAFIAGFMFCEKMNEFNVLRKEHENGK